MPLMDSPPTNTSPEVGVSRPPRRCSSVLLPEPEAPTMATRSPAATARLTPFNTSTRYSPSWKCFTSWSQRSRAVSSVLGRTLFIAQRLGRLGAGGAPGGIQGGQHREQEARHGDAQHV